MKKTIALFFLAAVFLGGCSGREEPENTNSAGSSGSGSLGIGAAQEAAAGSIRLFSEKSSLSTGVGDVTTVTALVTDDSNRGVAGFEVDFSSDGGVLRNVQATTDESGEAIAELSLLGEFRNRDITVTASVGNLSTELPIAAIGTEIQMDAPSDVLAGQTAPVTFTLAAGDSRPIPNQTITLVSSAGNTLSESTLVTDALGQARVDVGTNAGSDTLVVTALGGSVSQSFSLTVAETVEDLVTDLSVRVVSDQSSIETGGRNVARVSVLVTDDASRAIPDLDVSFSADGGILQKIETTTNDDGEASAELSLAGDNRNRNITVTATVGENTASLLILSTGTSLAIDAPEDLITGQTANLTLTLTAGDAQPIPNQIVQISSAAGNNLSAAALTTDAAGQVTLTMGTDQGTDTLTATALDGTVSQAFPIVVANSIQDVVTEVRIRVISNETAIETGGNDIARITTLVTDESNRVISGKEVQFSSTGGVLQNISSITNEAGQATAELSLAGDFRNQEITVEAIVDDQTGSVKVSTSGSALSIAGPTALVTGNTAELEITLSGGNDQPIANEPVEILSSAGNIVSNSSATTNASGKVLINVGSLAGDDVITVNALDSTVTATHIINVAEDILEVQTIADVDYNALPVDEFQLFRVRWESSGIPVEVGTLKFSTTAGVVRNVGASDLGSSSVLVDVESGLATIEVKSSSAGPATIAFVDNANSELVSQFDVEFVAVDASTISVEASPASVATGNPSTVSAIVTDNFGNPVKNVVVEFSSSDLRGGSLSPVTALTDSDGKARITFTAGNLATQQNEISIVASATDFPSVESNVLMTVTERQLNVIIGLAGSVEQADNDTRYLRSGVVQVTDGAGRPVPDASILVTLRPVTYRFGRMVTIDVDGDGEPDQWARAQEFSQDHADALIANNFDPASFNYSFTCASEDTNGNRILDTTDEDDTNDDGILNANEDINANGIRDVNEDVNGNGELDPRDPALIAEDRINTPTVIGGEITTDSNGVGFFSLAYPQSNALWFDVLINARVQALGTESVADYDTPLAALLTTTTHRCVVGPSSE